MKKNHPVTGVERSFSEEANILSTTDLKGAVSYVNEDFIEISGFEQEELLGRNHNMVRHPDMPPAAFADLWGNIKTGSPWMGIVKNRCKNGDHYWVDAYVTPIVKNGQVAEFQSVRTKPDQEHVNRADTLYQSINNGRVPRAAKSRALPLKFRLMLGGGAALAATALISVLLGGASVSMGAAGFGVGLLVMGALTHLLVAPMDKALAEMREVVNNPLMQYVYTGRNDEAGQILLTLKMLKSESGGIVGRIADTAECMITGSNGLLSTVEESNQGVLQQHDETDMVATAVTEMTSSIQEVADNARSTSEAAENAATEAENGRKVVQQTTQTIQALSEEVMEVAGVIQKLEQDSTNISSVLDVISGIAEQTNLLALNAAIEAARAGEQGRGFAVVADEVRELATRTHNSTQEIQSMIEQLQGAAREAVQVMDKGKARTEESVSQAGEAARSLDAIAEAVTLINSMNAQIAVAVNEQSSVADEINRSIIHIRDLSQLTVDSSRESEKAGTNMNGASHRLLELAQQFWQRL